MFAHVEPSSAVLAPTNVATTLNGFGYAAFAGLSTQAAQAEIERDDEADRDEADAFSGPSPTRHQ